MALCVTRVAISLANSFAVAASWLNRAAAVLLPRRLAYQQARRVDLRRHIRQHELDRLKLRDGMPKCHPFLRPLQRRLKCALRNARGLRRNPDSSSIQRRKRHLIPFAFIPDAIRFREPRNP